MPLIIAGTIVAFDPNDPTAARRGRVCIGDDGLIAKVVADPAAVPVEFAGAPTVDVGTNFVLPGFIDLHNHLGYNTLPLWSEPLAVQPIAFKHHNSWTHAESYQSKITWPAWVIAKADPAALLAYVQARALVGGTTAIQGWPAANRKLGEAIRNIDREHAGTSSADLIYTAVVTKTPLELSKLAQKLAHGTGFIYHCAEGQRGSVVENEFTDVAAAGCLTPTFIGIHCNAVTDADWQRWAVHDAGGLAWSPFSNLWLYGETTDITAARARHVTVCLGSDWGPSGTKNVLGELKVARLASDYFGFGLTDADLVAMITTNPGDLLGRAWHRQVGRLVPGGFADITVLRPRGAGPMWSQIVHATEADVLLTVVGGTARYGTVAYMKAAGAKGSPLTVAGAQRRIMLADPAHPDQNLAWADVTKRLRAIRTNPSHAVAHAARRRAEYAGPMDAAEAPLDLALDMPGGGALAYAGPPPDVGAVVIPPAPSLTHDTAFLHAVHGHGFHAGILDGLATYYP